ncbi:MAG: photosystem II stability/assembly factor-like uncharacterized protein [Parvicella sp.]|jgi:photosystem II stability/assembly factor-like uncharacterized protein
MKTNILITLASALLITLPSIAQKKKKGKDASQSESKINSGTLSGLKFRNVGPALTSGRIADLAVNPNNSSEYYVAVASGGVWKTTNAGTTYDPIFDGEGSYSIGCVTIDPNNSNIVWVGTGENNNQRSVAYGDGIYKSPDGGKSWKNMGLKKSEHIGMIKVHPKKSNVVYAAAYGPLWSEGGERGLYKSKDGGETWKLILEIDKHTGINEIHFDPEDASVIYATAHQRRRHVFTYVSGGPGSGVHKSEDGGKTWKTINKGLPAKMGRIGMAVSPVDRNVLYAIAEGEDKSGGFFKSTDRGASWNKMNSYKTSGNYYQELICDPVDVNKVFAMDTWLHHTEDGGKTFVKTGEDNKHVDNHCIWIDPNNTKHWIVGCDGGLYETYDHASSWMYKPNLPVTQFYKVAVDNATPFYNIYGGTQDNNSLGGPSQTRNVHGIMNQDWVITNGGDGFESAIDPIDDNIVYAQSQYGWLVRYDKRTGEKVGIKPQPKAGEAIRWNWDAPLIISPHNHKRLYFAANVLFRSDDQGTTWTQISEDLSQGIDRNQLKVMGRLQSADAIMKNKSTTMYGNIVALDESPLQEGLLYAGTDDGLIHVTEDNGATWRKISSFPAIPANTYVNAIVTSKHDVKKVYAVFNNHKNGDFKPYILVSMDKGATWKAVQGNLPERGSVYDIAEDNINGNLLFAGTEFGLFTSIDAGKNWIQMKSGLPTVAIRDIEIQERESDLVLASFGRGFYVLDDFSPLRQLAEDQLKPKAVIYPIADAFMFVQANPLGLSGKGSQGASFFNTPNPEVGAVFTVLINDTTKSAKATRQAAESDLIKEGKDVAYPTYEELKKEDTEEDAYLVYTIYDKEQNPVRKMTVPLSAGMQRVVWDFRYTPRTPIKLKEHKPGRYGSKTTGALALPGTYYVSVSKVDNGKVEEIVAKTSFECKWLEEPTLTTDKDALFAFQLQAEKLRNAVSTTSKFTEDLSNRITYLEKAIVNTPTADLKLLAQIQTLKTELALLKINLWGDETLSSRDVEEANSISGASGTIIWTMWEARANVTETNKRLYQEAGTALESVVKALASVDTKIKTIEKTFDEMDLPYTPGRFKVPDWKMD